MYAFTSLPLVREKTGPRVFSARNAYRFCKDMATLAQETFQVLTLATDGAIIGRHLISLGLANCTLAHPREVFRPAVLDGAIEIVLVHNHVSGDPSPSDVDWDLTRNLCRAGQIMDIPVVDHIIIGRGKRRFCSLRSLRKNACWWTAK